MAENVFPYGSFGRAIYDPDERGWRFQRDVGQATTLRQLQRPSSGRINNLDLSSLDDENASEQPAVYFQKQLRHLSRAFPIVQPASDAFASLYPVSKALERVNTFHDPIYGSLVSQGHIYVESSRRAVRAIAHASGPSGSDLRIITLTYENQFWEGVKDEWLVVPTARGEEGTWLGDGVPICQIVFSQSSESQEYFIALRLPTKVLVFRPLLSKRFVLGMSQVNPNTICELPRMNSGENYCAHVSFNPWYPRQLATIDSNSEWCLWDLEGKRTITAKASTRSDISASKINEKLVADGWARIMWLQNPNTVIVCTRLKAEMYDVSASPTFLQRVSLGPSSGSEWIFDVIVLAPYLDHIAFLTSTHLILLKLNQSLNGDLEFETVSAIRHYLDSNEPVTKMQSCLLDEDTMLLTLQNGKLLMTCVVTGFSNGQVSTSAPSTNVRDCDVPNTTDFTNGVDFQLCTVEKKQRGRNQISLDDHVTREDIYLSAAVLQEDRSLVQGVWSLGKDTPMTRRLQDSVSTGRFHGRATRAPQDKFIIPDEAMDEEEESEIRGEPISRFAMGALNSAIASERDRTSVNHVLMARRLINGNGFEATVFRDIVGSAQRSLDSQNREASLPWRTLSEHGTGEHQLLDIEEASQRLDELRTNHGEDGAVANAEEPVGEGIEEAITLVLENVQWSSSSDAAVSRSTISEAYDRIISRWISPLSDVVPGRSRLAKDRLARQMAIQVTLASQVVRTALWKPAIETEQETGDVQTWELPLRGTIQPYQSSETGQASTQWSDAMSQPLLTPRTTPSVRTASSSHPSTFLAPEVSRLTNYTTFTKPMPTSLPRSLNRVLSHWQTGSDPDEYDWLSSRTRVRRQAEAEEAESQLTERDRRRLRKQAERLLQKQRKENNKTPEAQYGQVPQSSQQLPSIATFSASQQPGHNIAFGSDLPSSQTFGASLAAPASQVVPGKFGGRPTLKKKRKQGF